jgi:hypothetical protein
MFSWNRFTGSTTDTDYQALRYAALLKVEEVGGVPSTQPYLDSQSPPDPTMGVGFNLTVDDNRDAILTNMGFDVINASADEQQYIDRIIAAIAQVYATGDNDTLRANLNTVMSDWATDTQIATQNGKSKRSSFTLSETEVAEIFELIAPDYEAGVNNWAAEHGLGIIPNSRERVALFSLAWNSRRKRGREKGDRFIFPPTNA